MAEDPRRGSDDQRPSPSEEARLAADDGRSKSPERKKEPTRTPWRVDPAADGRGKPDAPKGPMGGMRWRPILIAVVVVVGLNFWLSTLLPGGDRPSRISYNPTFIEQVRGGNVKEIASKGETISGEFKREFDPPGEAKPNTKFITEVPTFANADQLSALLQSNNVEINATSPIEGRSLLASFLISLLPTLLIIGVFVYFIRKAAAGAGAGGMGGFGKSKAKRVDQDQNQMRTTFDDVAGIDEAEDELKEIVDFLKNPDKYKSLGARIPKGVLLSGPPGTGKTLLARAMAGEADAAFFTASAAEFIEMIVGVGASRVRDLFETAKKAAPAIIFIDELDAIGRSRGGGNAMGGHDEREQTLNQILTEMDGFDPSIGVIVLGGDEPPGGPRLRAAAPGPLRPPRDGAAAGQGRPRGDPPGPHALRAARGRGRPLRHRLLHARHGRRGPREPHQRGGAPGRPPRPQAREPAGPRGRARAGRARRGAQGRHERGGARAHGLPRGRPRARRDAHPRAPTRSARSRSSRAAWPSA